MNTELIDKLYKRSMVPSGLDGLGGSYMVLDEKKFAKAIVDECLNVIRFGMQYSDYNDQSDQTLNLVELKAQRWCHDAIKEKFGIE